ncbi:dTDP-glucose 4,6-dehydratase [Paenibacillus filicis]|uniref:dTDP-glucose 4,6-dehydratase n=1 Tax=Paenibacillus gyeongsangnamensis TaxID=3388067 RepID=A0ABT4Q6P3_9BACL|nr:dTDP-glucose 4,6-dehydratase [Paenibacillus filicis]MCZ8512544.1 dTDP-glucose 4,6-dehydratase [Paenibacillus filicis]
MRLLVTGGAGFIGSNFIHHMISSYSDYEIINLDALTYAGNLENLTSIQDNPKYTFIKGDITDRKLVDTIFQMSPDYVIHFAAESHVDRSILDPGIFVQTNVTGTQVLLEAARKYNIKKFVHVSTDEVYGTLGETGLFSENTPLSPNSPYSASKAGADMLVRAYHETYGINVNITRCSNNYGPYQFPEKLIPLMIANAFEEKPLPVYGDGLNVRDWLHVEDHCRAIDLVLHAGRSGEIYNVGGKNERTNLQIVKAILQELNKPESLISFVQDRPGHDRRYAIDAQKITTELSWRPQFTFESGIRSTINWYLNHKDWWNRIRSGTYREYYMTQYANRLGENL